MDACARAFLAASEMLDAGVLTAPLVERYAGWDGPEGSAILAGQRSLAELADRAVRSGPIRSRARDGRNIWNPWSTATSDRVHYRTCMNEWETAMVTAAAGNRFWS